MIDAVLTSAVTAPRVPRVFAWIAFATGAFGLMSIIGWILRTYHPMPWFDEWDTMRLFQQMEDGERSWLEGIFSQHNEHRLAIPRLFFALDFFVFGGTSILLFAATLLLQVVLAAIICAQIFRMEAGPGVKLALSGIAAALLFSGQQMSIFLWAFQVQWPLVYGGAVLALYCGDGFVRARERSPNSMAQWAWLLAAGISGFCSTFSMANGLLVWPLLIFLVVRFARPFSWVAAVLTAGVAVAVIGLFLNHFFRTGSYAVDILSVDGIVKAIAFVVAYLGSPFVFLGAAPVYIVGTLVLLTAIGLGALLIFGRKFMTSSEAMLALALLMIVGTAMITSAGRAAMGFAGATESRYVMPNLIGLSCLLAAVGSLAMRHPLLSEKPWRFVGLSALSVLVSIYAVGSHLKLPYDYAPIRDIKSKAVSALVSGAHDVPAISGVTGHLTEGAIAMKGFLLRHGAGPYATVEARAVGKPVADVATKKSTNCVGNFDAVLEKFDGGAGGASYYGWAWDKVGRKPPSRIYIVDATERVVGVGVPGGYRKDVNDFLEEVDRDDTGWVGQVGPKFTPPLIAFAELHDHSLCQLQNTVTP